MDTRTLNIKQYKDMTDEEKEHSILIPEEQLKTCKKMNRKARRAWIAKQKRK